MKIYIKFDSGPGKIGKTADHLGILVLDQKNKQILSFPMFSFETLFDMALFSKFAV